MEFKALLLTLFALSTPFAQAANSDSSLIDWSNQILSDVSATSWKPELCVDYLSQLGKKLDQVSAAAYPKEVLKSSAPVLIENLWRIRLSLHDHLEGASNDCAREIRNSFRRFRFLEDFLGEIQYAPENLSPNKKLKFTDQPTPIDETLNGYLLQTRDQNFKLQPGDIILARGVSFLSAMISRLGDIDSQFSHVVLLTENPDSKAIETIESYVGKGVSIYQREEALKNENSRLLILRARDQELAQVASKDMRDLVESRQGKNKIYYDYALDFNEHSTLSCAEVAQVAFLNAGTKLKRSFLLPERPSTLTRGVDLLKKLGITPGNTFTPGDLEYDSRFEIVGEWRDLRLTRDSRLKDAILSKILSWMDQEHSVLVPSFTSKMANGFVYDARRTPFWFLIKLVLGLDNFSKEIPRNMLSTVALVNQLGTGVLKKLQALDDEHITKTGLSMTYLELYDTLEKMKTEDTLVFQNPHTRKKSILIQYLRPVATAE